MNVRKMKYNKYNVFYSRLQPAQTINDHTISSTSICCWIAKVILPLIWHDNLLQSFSNFSTSSFLAFSFPSSFLQCSLNFNITTEEKASYQTVLTLTIRKFSDKDVGTYTCISTNSLGRKEGTIRLYSKQNVTYTLLLNDNKSR